MSGICLDFRRRWRSVLLDGFLATEKRLKRSLASQQLVPTSVTYDTRIFSFREKVWTVSLTTTGGRERFVLAIGNYQLGLLKGQNPKTATFCKRKDGSYYLNIQLEFNQPSLHQAITFWAVISVGLILQFLLMDIHLAVNKLPELNYYAKLRANIQQKPRKAHGALGVDVENC